MRWFLALLATCLVPHLAIAPRLTKIQCPSCNQRTELVARCETPFTCGRICEFTLSTKCPGCKTAVPTDHDHARPVMCKTCGVRRDAAPGSLSSSSSARSSSSSLSDISARQYSGGR
ncbi:hypothetical protein PSHT_13256 [Puccinia striiformis]|uniref:Uncharacterized protein n=1 Tax=Puccinia striiformis TaxID=27350 RepID=A0A2S4US22_9BASI|nr:hypothetical protein PSHT_13256 [Puccinia striiformis]